MMYKLIPIVNPIVGQSVYYINLFNKLTIINISDVGIELRNAKIFIFIPNSGIVAIFIKVTEICS